MHSSLLQDRLSSNAPQVEVAWSCLCCSCCFPPALHLLRRPWIIIESKQVAKEFINDLIKKNISGGVSVVAELTTSINCKSFSTFRKQYSFFSSLIYVSECESLLHNVLFVESLSLSISLMLGQQWANCDSVGCRIQYKKYAERVFWW